MWVGKGWFSEHLAQGPTAIFGHLSCQELKAFCKTREGHLKGQESSQEWGRRERAENEPGMAESVKSIIVSD